jgi:tetratricopeptide (TPR) repeat protein
MNTYCLTAWNYKGFALRSLQSKDDESELLCFKKALLLNKFPNDVYTFFNKGLSLYGLRKYVEALNYFDKTINLDPINSEAFNKKGITLNSLYRFKEAVIMFDKAIKINPNVISYHNNRKIAIHNLKNNN